VARPLIVAHRGIVDGASAVAENTTAAVAASATAGADAVELDVRRTRDGDLVLGHDPVQWRRRGPLRIPFVVAWSRRRSLAFLDDLASTAAIALDAGLRLRLDVKDAAALPKVISACEVIGMNRRQIGLWCRSPGQLAAVGPDVRASFDEFALLSNQMNTRSYVDRAVGCGATAVSFHPRALNDAAVAAAHQLGLIAYAWIRRPDAHAAAVAMGVDGLVTDWVAAARASVAGPA
jgi:myo-inositol-1(or 4)-monophosphatase/deoxyribonuclease-2